jgi:cobaltochelatase CobN
VHLLAATPGQIDTGEEAIDLGQSPGEILVLSAADTELAGLAAAVARLDGRGPSVRLANLLKLSHPMSVDVYVEHMVPAARLIVVRLLGGEAYWAYGVDQVAAAARDAGVPVAFLPGDDQPDDGLARRSSIAPDEGNRLWRYLAEGGPDNLDAFLQYAASIASSAMVEEGSLREPRPLLRAGVYGHGSLAEWQAVQPAGGPAAALVFYRALYQAGTLSAVDALIEALAKRGIAALPLYVASLKDEIAAETVARLTQQAGVGVVLNCTGFAVSAPGAARSETPFDALDCPVLQVVLASGTEETWREGTSGLSARDIAMQVALPEVDGRILTRAVAFKSAARFDQATECDVVEHVPVADRVGFVGDLAANWLRLRHTPVSERRVALVLANYPTKDGRLGNGVGLDTPAATAVILDSLKASGYSLDGVPPDGATLMRLLGEGPTNAAPLRGNGERWPLAEYSEWFEALPKAVPRAVSDRWGAPEDDPAVADGAFNLPVHRFGNVLVAVQPARGYQIDPAESYHDPALVPPHAYLAFYGWLRTAFDAHAVVHVGKHGNMEWLPGKALALSENCFPEAAFGPLPHLYPFIVNDPGEGSQAKRRAQAVIVDHLTPPLARAEAYGPYAELERLVDEYYEAAGVDPRRLALLRRQILDQVERLGLATECGIADGEPDDTALGKLDAYLCELKEWQIRDGLHIFGRSPGGEQRASLLVALTRLERGSGEGGDASILRALSRDLGLDGFDPLERDFAEPWAGPRPVALGGSGPWRTAGDTVERLEALALDLVAGRKSPPEEWPRTSAVLQKLTTDITPAIDRSGAAEIAGLLAGLDGRFVMPGPSGAPTRGRPEVLPTGRNFYSVDSRAVPTPAAWTLGWKSASLLVERYVQDHGEYPRTLALSAWGTANMRTGGDDIAQALALLGVQPTWATASGRVTGFGIMPASVLGRPRVDVTLRVSGFFRDAFPAQIDLIDSAVRAVAALDEPADVNPVAAAAWAEASPDDAEAWRQATYRVFGSKPGAYGAGLQALIDSSWWDEQEDLARAYTLWSGYAYGGGAEGVAAHKAFARRLGRVQAVLHNQDNREHDLLDSDDYYQFEGGLAAAVAEQAGATPSVYHNDHSRPERPAIRRLEEEIGRVVRARAANPKWIEGARRHGYKGAFEMAATVDYLFAFAATTGAVQPEHFEALFDAYLGDDTNRAFIAEANPTALGEICARFSEALRRGLWQSGRNDLYDRLDAYAREASAR